MKNGSAYSVKTKYYSKDFFWAVINNCYVTLLNFETYGEHIFPEKFKIILSDEKEHLEEFLIDLSLDRNNENYQQHDLGISFDASLLKIEIVPLPSNNEFAETETERVSYKLNYKFSDEDRSEGRTKPKPPNLYVSDTKCIKSYY